jgi:hypothetical protein
VIVDVVLSMVNGVVGKDSTSKTRKPFIVHTARFAVVVAVVVICDPTETKETSPAPSFNVPNKPGAPNLDFRNAATFLPSSVASGILKAVCRVQVR